MDILDTVFVSTNGTSLTLEGDTLRAYRPDDDTKRRIVPLLRVESLVLWRGVDVSADLLRRCAELGIHVTWITQYGRLVASVTGSEPGRPELRLAQFRAHESPDARIRLARLMVAGKLQNYRQLLLRAARDAAPQRQAMLRSIAEDHARALVRLGTANSLPEVMGAEGQAARSYFGALDLLIAGSPPYRTRRPPTDPVNCYLSSGYGLLRSAVHSAVVHSGFDPFVGYLHGIRAGKPSLVLDLMEQFRPLLVDRMVATAFNRNEVRDSYWQETPGGAVHLTDAGWKHLLGLWIDTRQRKWPHRALGRQVSAAELPILQARSLARHLREPAWPYEPWVAA